MSITPQTEKKITVTFSLTPKIQREENEDLHARQEPCGSIRKQFGPKLLL